VGRALTMQSVDVYEFEESDYELEIAAVDSLQPGDVIVASTQQSTRTSLWGELLSTAAIARGANGAVIDGYTRDTRVIRAMGFPLFATGMHPVDSAGRSSVISYNRPINCGGVLVNPGDIVFGDLDGVVVIPSEAAQEVIEQAVAKVTRENTTRDALRQGATLRQVFDRYGVL
jgi:4-hydroxy-4-methyl-2-oxoglutarate aldolase